MTEYEYEYYSVWKNHPNTNTNIIRFENIDRIRIRIFWYSNIIRIIFEYRIIRSPLFTFFVNLFGDNRLSVDVLILDLSMMFLYWSVNKELYFNLGESIWFTADWPPAWPSSAVQKIKKLSETPVSVHNIAKLCVIDGKNREITKKLV